MTDLAPGMMTDLQGNVVPIPQGAQQQTIAPSAQPQEDNMMTDLQGNRVPIPKDATQEAIPQPGAVSRFGSGVWAGTKAMLPHELPSVKDVMTDLSPAGPLIRGVEQAKGAYDEYQQARKEGQPIISSVASGAGTLIGLDPEGIRERAGKGDVAGVVGEAVPSVVLSLLAPEAHERVAKAFQSDVRALQTASASHNAAIATYDQRLGEHGIAVDQAIEASRQAEQAKSDFQDGKITKQQYDDINTRASAASANAMKANKALVEAHDTRAAAAADVDRLSRKIQKSKGAITAKQTEQAAAAREDFKKAVPPAPKGPAAYTDHDLDVADAYLENHHKNVEEIGSKKDVAGALNFIQQDMERQVAPYREKYANEPITRNIRMDVREQLADNPRVDFIEKGMKALEPYNLIDPTVEEADRIRKQLNAEVRGRLQDTKWGLATALEVDPEFAAKYHALDSLRNGEYDLFEDKGVKGIRELRQDEASVIRVRNAAERNLENGDVKVRGSNQPGAVRKAAQWAVNKAGIGIGAKVAGPAGAVVGDIATNRTSMLGKMIYPDDLTRDQLIQRRMKNQVAGVPITEITGTPQPSGPFSPPNAVSPQMQLYVPQRELSPLHTDLATHYGENVNNTPYVELEDRFKQDLADKRRHGVPLESDEKTLLGKINAADAADSLAAQKQMQEMAAKGKTTPQFTLPDQVEPVLQIPRARMHPAIDTPQAIAHDIAHIVVGSERGIEFPDGIRSHLHPENQASGDLMSAPIDWTPFVDDEGNVDPVKLKSKMADIAATYMAGGVANDLYHDLPFSENQHLGADIRSLRGLLKDTGFTTIEANKMIAQAAEDAAQILAQPGVQEAIEKHSAVREAGLNPKYHVSPERMEQILQDVKNQNEVTTGKSSGTTGERKTAGTKAGAGAETDLKEGVSGEFRQKKQGPTEGKGGTVRENEPAGPKFGGEPDEDKLIMNERQSARKQPYTVHILDRGATEPHIEEIPAFSGKDALKVAQKNFPEGYSFGIEGSKSAAPVTEYSAPTKKPLSMPDAGPDRPPVKTFRHELGHAMVGLNEGMETNGMLRHTHPDMRSNARASVSWSLKNIADPITRRILPDKLPSVIRTLMGGIAADEAFNNVPRELNHNYDAMRQTSDGGQAFQMLRAAGYTPAEAHSIMDRAIDQAKQHLTRPEVSGIISENENVREPDLSRQYHYSPERLQQMHAEAQRRIQNGPVNNRAIGGEGGEGRTGNVSGTEATAAPGTGQTVQAAELVPNPEDLADRMVERGLDPNFADKRAKQLIEAASGKGMYNGTERRVAENQIKNYMGPERRAQSPKNIIEKQGLVYKGEVVPGSGVHQFEHPNEPGKTAALKEPFTGEQVKTKMASKLAENPIVPTNPKFSENEDYTPEQKKFTSQWDNKYKLASEEVDGRKVRENVPDFGSINATLGVYPGSYDVLDGVREIPMSEFEDMGSRSPRIDKLAKEIDSSKEINPLIVGVDHKGPYIIEGSHRFDALRKLGAKSFPAVVAVDLTDEGIGTTPKQKTEEVLRMSAKFENPKLSSDRVSTRVPEGKNATENPLEGEPLVINRKSIEASPQKLQDRFAQKVREIPGVKVPKNISDNAKVYDRFVGHVADNLKYLYDQATPEQQENNQKWYDSAHNMTKQLADKHGITHPQAAGVTAAMSPQMDWDQNVSLAKRIIDIYKNHADKPVTPEMIQKGRDIIEGSRKLDKKANTNLENLLSGIEGKKIGELTGWDRAAALRLYDEVNNPRQYPRIDPATGNEMELRTNADGSPANVAWGNLNNIGKALSILDDGSRENISNQVGSSHKVRNFYNNIIDPTNPDDVTIDTHAVAAGLMQPLGGNAKIVTDNFGGAGKAAGTGVKGTYPLYADAYRQAAKDLGLLPRQLQSVVWEKIRELFPAEWKTKENLTRVNQEWNKYQTGKQTLEKTRQNIIDMPEKDKLDKQPKKQDNRTKAGIAALGA